MADINKPTIAHKPIADVAHPSDAIPTDTSKPVIVTNRPILRDPMMTDDLPTVGKPAAEKPSLTQVANKVNIQPLTEEVIETTGNSNQPATATKESEAAIEPASRAVSKDDNPETDDETLSKPTADQIGAEAAKQTKHDAELQALADSKKYFLPINATERRRTKKFMILGASLSLLLILIWLDIALDAGLIKLGSAKAITHFFSS